MNILNSKLAKSAVDAAVETFFNVHIPMRSLYPLVQEMGFEEAVHAYCTHEIGHRVARAVSQGHFSVDPKCFKGFVEALYQEGKGEHLKRAQITFLREYS